MAVLAMVLAAPPGVARDQETAGARDQARRCLDLAGEPAVAACRQALALGLSPKRTAAVRRKLALELIKLRRSTEAVEVYRDAARERPEDADAHLRLGLALVHLAGRPEDALAALDEALKLRPADAEAHGARAAALQALGRHSEAVTAFEEALRADARYLEGRPAARKAYEAARAGEAWPPP